MCRRNNEVDKLGDMYVSAFFSHIEIADTFISRVRGLLGRYAFRGTLILANCSDIHTWGMSVPLDVAFVDQKGKVRASYTKVAPRKRIKCPGARFVIERLSSDAPWVEEGYYLAIVGIKN